MAGQNLLLALAKSHFSDLKVTLALILKGLAPPGCRASWDEEGWEPLVGLWISECPRGVVWEEGHSQQLGWTGQWVSVTTTAVAGRHSLQAGCGIG